MHLSSASDGRPRKLLDRLAPVTRGPCGGCWLVGRFIFKVILLSRLRERERGSVRPFALYTSSDVSTPLRPSKQHCLDVSYVHFTSLYFGCIVRTLGSGRAPHAAYARACSHTLTIAHASGIPPTGVVTMPKTPAPCVFIAAAWPPPAITEFLLVPLCL